MMEEKGWKREGGKEKQKKKNTTEVKTNTNVSYV